LIKRPFLFSNRPILGLSNVMESLTFCTLLHMLPAKILLIDNSNFDVMWFKMALTKWDRPCQLDVVTDGDQAMNLLVESKESNIPDMIVLDLKLPGTSGRDVLRKIREIDLFKSIPVLVFATSDSDKNAFEADNFQVRACVKKPTDFDEFRAVVFSMQDLLCS